MSPCCESLLCIDGGRFPLYCLQARERMKQKFGGSSGLSSGSGGGGMQGIGSDSSYRPASQSGIGLSTQDISAQMSGAFSYLSSALETGTKVCAVF
jgi:hypothetical protein